MTKLPPIANDEHAPRFQSEVWTRFAAAAAQGLLSNIGNIDRSKLRDDTNEALAEVIAPLADALYAEWLKRVEA